VIARADVVSLHLPLTERTRGLIGRAEQARMKSDAFLINTSRGACCAFAEATVIAAASIGRLAS
jgi:phosphoglycerate dehydrogenase-like enzyme